MTRFKTRFSVWDVKKLHQTELVDVFGALLHEVELFAGFEAGNKPSIDEGLAKAVQGIDESLDRSDLQKAAGLLLEAAAGLLAEMQRAQKDEDLRHSTCCGLHAVASLLSVFCPATATAILSRLEADPATLHELKDKTAVFTPPSKSLSSPSIPLL